MAKEATEDEWTVSLKTNGTLFNFKLDTGAQAKVVPRTLILALQKRARGKIITSKSKVKSTERISVGVAWVLNIKYKGKDTWITAVPWNECISIILKHATRGS